jgi:hypothetical protein
VETQLDHTYLRPGLISRAAAVGLGAVGVGAGVLLACWGLSFFWRYDDPVVGKLEAVAQQLETLTQRTTDGLEALSRSTAQQTETMSRKTVEGLKAIDRKLEALDQKVAAARTEALNRGFGGVGRGDGRTVTGDVIQREVTVFSTVKHEAGGVVTGWVYKDGASDGVPMRQFCYYTAANFDGSSTRIDLALDGKRQPNIWQVPQVEGALAKCQWWSAS